MTQNTKPPVGSTGTLAELQAGKGDVVQVVGGKQWEIVDVDELGRHVINDPPAKYLSRILKFVLISRATQPAHIITHEGREYDLTALETPFGILKEKAPTVAKALQAWPHGWEKYIFSGWKDSQSPSWVNDITYRAKPAPVEVRVECYRGVAGVGGKYGTCIKRADGAIDWTTWEAEP